MNRRDGQLKLSLALPNGAATTTSASLDTGKVTAAGSQTAPFEVLLTAPALATAAMPDAKTMTYDILGSANADLSSPTVLSAGAIVQTGASGAGAASKTTRFRLPTNAPRYFGFRAVGSGTGNASASSAKLEVLF